MFAFLEHLERSYWNICMFEEHYALIRHAVSLAKLHFLVYPKDQRRYKYRYKDTNNMARVAELKMWQFSLDHRKMKSEAGVNKCLFKKRSSYKWCKQDFKCQSKLWLLSLLNTSGMVDLWRGERKSVYSKIKIFDFRENWMSSQKYECMQIRRSLRGDGGSSVYSLGILAALRRMDTQEAPAA